MSSSSAKTAKTVNRLLWIAQSLAAALFLFAGSMKFIIPADKMQQGPIVLPIAFLYFIGICEVLGAFGLLLPSVLRIRTALTPLAAAGLTVIMIGATTITVLSMGVAAAILPAAVGLLTTFITYGRTRIVPIANARTHRSSRRFRATMNLGTRISQGVWPPADPKRSATPSPVDTARASGGSSAWPPSPDSA